MDGEDCRDGAESALGGEHVCCARSLTARAGMPTPVSTTCKVDGSELWGQMSYLRGFFAGGMLVCRCDSSGAHKLALPT